MKIKRNIPLSQFTSFKIGGPAKYFISVKKKEDLIKAVNFSKEKKLPFLILGGGSNVLINDKGFSGLVILINNKESEIKRNRIYCQAGMKLNNLVNQSVKNNLTGLEWAAGIPGTIGGAVRGNAGAFGFSISQLVKQVEVFNKDFSILEKKDCRFNYRESIFKKNKKVIFSLELELRKGNRKQSEKMIKEYLEQRKNNCPLDYSSAGCIFKNPKPLIAAQLIEQVNLKGKQIGQAMVSEKHANFIVNLGKAKAEDVLKLIKLAKKEVKKKFNLVLEEEIQIF